MMLSAEHKWNLRLIAKALRYYRLKEGYTQEALSEKINASRNYMSLLENCKRVPSLQMLLKICDVLHIDLADIFIKARRDGKRSIKKYPVP